MKTRSMILAVGIALQLSALFVDHATDIPPVLRVIAPRYFYASQTVKALEADSSLTMTNSDDRGYAEIAAVLVKYTARHANWKDSSGIRINTINVLGSAFIEGKLSTSINWAFELSNPVLYKGVFANRGTDNWSFEIVKSEIEDLKQPNILLFSFLIFIIGSVIDIFAFRMESN